MSNIRLQRGISFFISELMQAATAGAEEGRGVYMHMYNRDNTGVTKSNKAE